LKTTRILEAVRELPEEPRRLLVLYSEERRREGLAKAAELRAAPGVQVETRCVLEAPALEKDADGCIRVNGSVYRDVICLV
jgi:hypothetical protein